VIAELLVVFSARCSASAVSGACVLYLLESGAASYDVVLSKDVPFEGSVDMSHHLGGQMPPRPQFWEREDMFKPNS